MKDNFMKKILIGVFIFLLIFTGVILYLFYHTDGAEPSTLIACVFAACIGEFSICGIIQTNKNKYKKDGTVADKIEEIFDNDEMTSEEGEDDGNVE